MKVGDIFTEQPVTQDEILKRELTEAKVSFPNAASDLHALALLCSARKNALRERTNERDFYASGGKEWRDSVIRAVVAK